MKYSRQHPSPAYDRLVTQYRQMHDEGDKARGLPPEQTYPGRSLAPHVESIKHLIRKTNSKEILDYGSGKGEQYRFLKVTNSSTGEKTALLEYWDVNVSCYDPSYEPFTTPPSSKYDGVICTDVLEHCPQEDMEWIVEDLFSHAKRFVYTNAACYPAFSFLPNGENAHCTVQPPEWWHELFVKVAAKYPDVIWMLKAIEKTDHPDGSYTLNENVFGNVDAD